MTTTADAHAAARFGPEATSAAAARRFVADTLEAWGAMAIVPVATLLVSELVANVVLHAGTELDVVVRRRVGVVRFEVVDRSPGLPARKRYSPTATTGRGLGLVEDLSRDWGVDTMAGGKAVWFELDASDTPSGPTSASLVVTEEGDDGGARGRAPRTPPASARSRHHRRPHQGRAPRPQSRA